MMEGAEAGSIPLTSGSGSGGPKTCGSGGSGFGSGTLLSVNRKKFKKFPCLKKDKSFGGS
jgi:hypothetical protein